MKLFKRRERRKRSQKIYLLREKEIAVVVLVWSMPSVLYGALVGYLAGQPDPGALGILDPRTNLDMAMYTFFGLFGTSLFVSLFVSDRILRRWLGRREAGPVPDSADVREAPNRLPGELT